jgi:hypothetical protein
VFAFYSASLKIIVCLLCTAGEHDFLLFDQRAKPYRYYHNFTHSVSEDLPGELDEVPHPIQLLDDVNMRQYINRKREEAGLVDAEGE